MLNHSSLNKNCGSTCSPCKCDSSCHRYGDCCADILDKNVTLEQNDKFDYSSCEEPEWTSFAGKTTAATMVSKCPLSLTLKDDDVTKCEQPDVTVKTQATPVSDVETLITYRNKFCAKCHAIDNYIEWTHAVSCFDASVLNDVSTNDGLWRAIVTSYCDIVSLPPESVPVHRCPRPPSTRATPQVVCRILTIILGWKPCVTCTITLWCHPKSSINIFSVHFVTARRSLRSVLITTNCPFR